MFKIAYILSIVFFCLTLPGCGPGTDQSREKEILLKVWAHAGQEAERTTLESQVERINQAGLPFRVELTLIPERSYNAQVQAAALAGDLPDVLEFDGPYLSNYVWQGHLRPLDSLLSRETKQDLIPSIVNQGTIAGKLYGVGTFDSGLGIYARESLLTAAGIRIPKGPGDAWSAKEFAGALERLAQDDSDGAVLDLKLNYPPEWFTYAFSPLIQSAGADLIERPGYGRSSGTLDNPGSVSALTQFQSWLQKGYVDPNIDDAAFTESRVALSWAGHWEYQRYHEAFGDDLIILPLPDMGHGSRTGQGSWVWGVTRKNPNEAAAAGLLEYLLSTEEILAMTAANGAVPATFSAIDGSMRYREGGPLHLFARQLTEGPAVPRPQTPAYPIITSAFNQAIQEIRNGKDVGKALSDAAAAIDQDIADNKGYPMSAEP